MKKPKRTVVESAREAFARLFREARERSEAALAAQVRAHEEAERARARRERRELIATWEPERVLAMIDAGRMTTEEVEDWFAAREEWLQTYARAAALATGIGLASGQVARVVELPGGRVAVAVGTIRGL